MVFNIVIDKLSTQVRISTSCVDTVERSGRRGPAFLAAAGVAHRCQRTVKLWSAVLLSCALGSALAVTGDAAATAAARRRAK